MQTPTDEMERTKQAKKEKEKKERDTLRRQKR